MLDLIAAADLWFENVMLAARTPFLLHIFSWITSLGDTIVVIGITGIVMICLLLFKNMKAYAAGLVAAVIGAGGTGYALKMIVGRARPSGLIPAATEASLSFPSMHATLAVALYGFLAYVLAKRYPRHAAAITILAVLGIFAIGFSRLYLGVHFPTDVLAGFVLGGVWLLAGIKISYAIRNGIVR